LIWKTREHAHAKTSSPIYVRADGSVDLSSSPVSRDDDLYWLIDNIITNADEGIVIERDNMTLDGAGYLIRGVGTGHGVEACHRTHLTLKNVEIAPIYCCALQACDPGFKSRRPHFCKTFIVSSSNVCVGRGVNCTSSG
jgi:hypothetical protein